MFSYWIDLPVYRTKQLIQLSEGKHEVRKGIIDLDEIGAFNVVWNKIYRADILNNKEKPIRFLLDSEPGEDLLFNCAYFEKIKCVQFVSQAFYHWMRYGENSLANQYRDGLFEKNKQFIQRKRQMFLMLDMNTKQELQVLAQCYLDYIYACIPNMYRTGTNYGKKDRIRFYKEILSEGEYNSQILSSKPKSRLQKQFKILYKMGNPYLIDMFYCCVLYFREHFKYFYNRIKKYI